MSRFIYAACGSFLLLAVYLQRDLVTKYKTVEAYEVQPGILALPTYAEDGQVCEIGIERRHYSPEIIRLHPSLSRQEIDKSLEELAPPAVRGQKLDSPSGGVVAGHGMTMTVEYENVSLQIYSEEIGVLGQEQILGNIAAVIRWKNRKCK